MAGKQLRKDGGYNIRFNYNKEPKCLGAGTRDAKEAESIVAGVERALKMLKMGFPVPPGVDPIDFIMSGGTLAKSVEAEANERITLAQICDLYHATSKKEVTTKRGEKNHTKHFLRLVGGKKQLAKITRDEMQKYVDAREKEKSQWTGEDVDGATIRKEILTFNLIWKFAKKHEGKNYVTTRCPVLDEDGDLALDIKKPKGRDEFEELSVILRRIERGSFTEVQKKKMLSLAFLSWEQVGELWRHVWTKHRETCLPLMVAMAAMGGLRRSEIARSKRSDFDFESGILTVWEKKKNHGQEWTKRKLPLTKQFADVAKDWFDRSPGGVYSVGDLPATKALTPDRLTQLIRIALKGSKWSIVDRFHLLRHSLATCYTRAGMAPKALQTCLGHTNADTTKIYVHDFENDIRNDVNKLVISVLPPALQQPTETTRPSFSKRTFSESLVGAK